MTRPQRRRRSDGDGSDHDDRPSSVVASEHDDAPVHAPVVLDDASAGVAVDVHDHQDAPVDPPSVVQVEAGVQVEEEPDGAAAKHEPVLVERRPLVTPPLEPEGTPLLGTMTAAIAPATPTTEIEIASTAVTETVQPVSVEEPHAVPATPAAPACTPAPSDAGPPAPALRAVRAQAAELDVPLVHEFAATAGPESSRSDVFCLIQNFQVVEGPEGRNLERALKELAGVTCTPPPVAVLPIREVG